MSNSYFAQMDAIVGFQKLHTTSSPSPIPSRSNNNAPNIHKPKQFLPKANQIPLIKLHSPKIESSPIKSVSIPSSSSHSIIDTQLKSIESIINGLDSNQFGIDIIPFVFVLDICFNLGAIDLVIGIHRLIPDHLLRKDFDLSSKLLRIYTECGRIEDAHQVFDKMPDRHLSALPWNWLMLAYIGKGLYEDAVGLYFQMVEEGVEPDKGTFPLALKACAGFKLVHTGEQVHSRIIRHGLVKGGFELNGLVFMYANCGDMVKAQKVFDKIGCKSLASFTSMLSGYIKLGQVADVMHIFRCMIQDGHEPGSEFISSILAVGLPLKLAAQIHGWVLRRGAKLSLLIASPLAVTYSKNGRLDACRWLLDHVHMLGTHVSSWNPVISGHHYHLEALKQMKNFSIAFVSLLSTCARLGMVKEGERLFSLMPQKYGVTPRREHYGCMVNLYARAGLIDKAYNLLMGRMVCEADKKAWGALLYACSHHNNVEIGEKAAERLFDLEPDNKRNFELLIEIYGSSGRLEDVERVRRRMLDRGLIQ